MIKAYDKWDAKGQMSEGRLEYGGGLWELLGIIRKVE